MPTKAISGRKRSFSPHTANGPISYVRDTFQAQKAPDVISSEGPRWHREPPQCLASGSALQINDEEPLYVVLDLMKVSVLSQARAALSG
jgi:hypothetical protein